MLTRSLVVIASLTTGVAAHATLTDEALDRLDARWRTLVGELDIPGVAITVVRKGHEPFYATYGSTTPDRDNPITPDTLFYIASCTKSFTAFAICQLAESGQLDLDEKVSTYIPEFRTSDQAEEFLTVRDLLSHRQGLEGTSLITAAEAFTGLAHDDYINRISQRDVTASGEYRYGNYHYTLVGRVIESATGLSWKKYLEEELFVPAGMSRTTTSADQMYLDANAAHPMLKTKGGRWILAPNKKTDRTMHAAGGIGSTATDMARWLALNLDGGTIAETQLLSHESSMEMQSPQVTLNERFGPYQRTAYGLGWHVDAWHNQTLVSHFGGYEGASAHVSFMPDQNLGVAILCNTSDRASTIFIHGIMATDVYNTLLGEPLLDEMLEAVKSMASKDPSESWTIDRPAHDNNPAVVKDGLSHEPSVYTGRYTHPDWGTIVLTYNDNELKAVIGDLRIGLVSKGTDAFWLFDSFNSASDAQFILEDGNVSALHVVLNAQGSYEFVRE
ncbi:MAG: serine hydrolase [Phycisphaerales bacterium JB043]